MRLPPAEHESEGPNLTPVIDVVFLLLIFFLVATKFDQQERLVSINLAEIFKPEPMAVGTKEVIVNITKEGRSSTSQQDVAIPLLVGLRFRSTGVLRPTTPLMSDGARSEPYRERRRANDVS